MKRQLLALSCLLISLCAMADDIQTVTIDGSTVSKTVTQITFNGDDVILHFSDNTSQTAAMDKEINISFELSPTYIDVINADEQDDRVYDLNGRCVGEGKWALLNGQLPKGIYIYKGKKVTINK